MMFDDLPQGGQSAPPKFDDLPAGTTFAQRFDAAPAQTLAGQAADFIRSIPGGISRGIANTLSAGGQAAQLEMGQPVDVPSPQGTQGVIEQNITGPQYQPAGMAGRFGQSIGETLGNPASFVGPGSMGLKLAGAGLAGAGGQAGEETGIPGGRLVGSLLGGAAAGKTFGPTAPKAEIPTYRDTKAAATKNYQDALNSGLEINPRSFANDFALTAKQDLQRRGFGTDTATFKAINNLRVPTTESGPGATITAPNLAAFRTFLARQARETQEGKPTENAAAAMVALQHYNNYLENLPPSAAVAGDPAAYVRATAEGNANYAAAQRMRTFDKKIMAAERAHEGGIATKLDTQIKSKTRQLLDRGQYVDNGQMNIPGWTPQETQAAETLNAGTMPENALRQVGRLSGWPLLHALFAEHTGGLSLPFTAAVSAAKKAAERMTVNRAGQLSDMLAQRSPLYQQRAAALPPNLSGLPNWAAPIRGGILGLQ